jgi:hypothetical protein
MATIKLHPSVSNYVSRFHAGAHTDAERLKALKAYEAGKLVILDGCDLGLDFDLFERVRIPPHPDTELQYLIAKLSMDDYLDVLWGHAARFLGKERPARRAHPDPQREAAFQELKRYLRRQAFPSWSWRLRLARQMVGFEQRVLQLYARLFPEYGYYAYSINWRLTESRGESLHVDAYRTSRDFHQVKLFVNLDSAPRIWNVGEQMQTLLARHYHELRLDQRVGQEYHRFLEDCDTLMFDRKQGPRDCQQTHSVFFDQGDVWMAETRQIPHQVFFGRKMVSVQFYIAPEKRIAPELSMEHFVAQLPATTGLAGA